MATTLSKAEKSYIVSSLASSPPIRHDGRAPQDYRPIRVLTGDDVAPLANGSGKVRVGGTEVVAAVRLEVEDLLGDDMRKGKVICNVICSPAAYPHLGSNQQDDIQSDLTSILQSAFGISETHSASSSSKGDNLSFSALLASDLTILPGRKAWLLNLDAVVLSDAGNVHDVLFMACRAALWDTRIPKTRAVEYRGENRGDTGIETADHDTEMSDLWKAAVQSKKVARATDFELEDYWDQGVQLSARSKCPVAVTLNILPSMHILDATQSEEQAIPLRLVVLYSFSKASIPQFTGMRLLGPGSIPMDYLKVLLEEAEKYAKQLVLALDAQLISQKS